MRLVTSILFALALATPACTVGDTSDDVVFTDEDGDGTTDGVDTDGDGETDFSTPPCTSCLPGQSPTCVAALVDLNADGIPDGVDFNCDGVIDLPFGLGGGGGGGTSQCISTVSLNGQKKQVKCTNGSCECRVNDVLTTTCTAQNPASSCSIPGNCCGF